MQYYKSKIIHLENTTKRFKGNEAMVVYSYGELNGYEYLGVVTDYSPEDVIFLQPTECETENIPYSELASVAINSAIARGVEDIVREKIHIMVPNADVEAKLINKGIIDKNNPEYVEYRAYVNNCLEWGRIQKANLGIVEP